MTGTRAPRAKKVRSIGRLRYWAWRYVGHHVSGWLDRRYQAKHLAEYGWPISMGMGPFSMPESRWHECEGHEWERFDWPYGRHVKRGHLPDRVTRCRNCGAPRCGTGEDRPLDCCTLERHHTEPHDFLSGERIEVGA